MAEAKLDYSALRLPERLNILWLVAEDLSAFIPAFGDSTVSTPHLSRLAAEGVRYPNLFSPSGVCAPARASIALGMYPTRAGAHHMRTGPWYTYDVTEAMLANQSQPVYEALPPPGVHMYSYYLRKAGYYCSNNPKEDYQFRREITAWDESSRQAHWRKRKAGQPFFAVFNFMVTHESRLWTKAEDSLWIAPDLEVPITALFAGHRGEQKEYAPPVFQYQRNGPPGRRNTNAIGGGWFAGQHHYLLVYGSWWSIAAP